MKNLRYLLLAMAVAATFDAPAATAASKQASGPTLDKFIPAKLAGWRTDGPFDPDNMFDHTVTVTQDYSGKNESKLQIQIFRVRPDNRMMIVPDLGRAKLGQLPEGGGFASLQTARDRKALVEYSKENQSGKLTAVAGRCVITIEGSQVAQDQLVAAASAIDMKGLDAACL
jgi:hypothetical protein